MSDQIRCKIHSECSVAKYIQNVVTSIMNCPKEKIDKISLNMSKSVGEESYFYHKSNWTFVLQRKSDFIDVLCFKNFLGKNMKALFQKAGVDFSMPMEYVKTKTNWKIADFNNGNLNVCSCSSEVLCWGLGWRIDHVGLFTSDPKSNFGMFIDALDQTIYSNSVGIQTEVEMDELENDMKFLMRILQENKEKGFLYPFVDSNSEEQILLHAGSKRIVVVKKWEENNVAETMTKSKDSLENKKS